MTTPTFAPPPPTDEVEIRDFTIKRKRIPFKIDDDIFYAYGILSVPLMQTLIRAAKSLGGLLKDEKFEGVYTIFDQVLHPESATRFRERAEAVGDDALDVKEQLIPILYFLLEKYGVRPTQLSSDSSTGSSSETGGISLTAGQPVLESIPPSSAPQGS